MSRIGKRPIPIVSGVTVKKENGDIKVKGPKGELNLKIDPEIGVTVEKEQVLLERPSDNKRHKSLHGLYNALISNMIKGVTEGYQKKLEIVGVGYKAELKGEHLQLQLGYSHPILFKAPEGIILQAPSPTSIVISGIDKQLVGEVSAGIRGLRPVEPYKGKGVKYEGEYVKRKAGKTAVAK